MFYSKNGDNYYKLTKVLAIEEITRVRFLKFLLVHQRFRFFGGL